MAENAFVRKAVRNSDRVTVAPRTDEPAPATRPVRPRPAARQLRPSQVPAVPAQLGGLRRNARETEDVGGGLGGDAARPVGASPGNGGGNARAVAGDSISTVTTGRPLWEPDGGFKWAVRFVTRERNGWIVQHVANTRHAEDAAGNALQRGLTRDYWEAWEVDGTGAVTPVRGRTNDVWARGGSGDGTQGHWAMSGSVHFTTTDPATQGFAPGVAKEAGAVPSSLTAPAGLGAPRLYRYAEGTWDSTGPNKTHTGVARPQ